ncbi:MAG: hypothetical protein CM15mP74_05810 [Halieaceae bacterium]|nr:MAG: hypothetical protein CM15mP74_05810 [Halieaceae bacterium]
MDVVKVMIDGELLSSGGGIKPGVLGFTDEELEVLVTEAHHRVCESPPMRGLQLR